MKKNTLLSILALSSAGVTAYANAPLNVIKADKTTDWTNATEGIELSNGVFTSSVTMSQTVTLVKGKYKLTATAENAKFTVNGAAYKLGDEITIAADEGTLKIDIDVDNKTMYGGNFTVGGFGLELQYDFAANKEVFKQKLSLALNKISIVEGSREPDANGKNIQMRGSEVAGILEKFEDGKASAYEVYKSNKLYMAVGEDEISKKIAIIDSDATANGANTNAYNYAITEYYKKVELAYNAALQNYEVAKNKVKDQKDVLAALKAKYDATFAAEKDALAKYKADADAALAANTAVEKYPSEAVKKASAEKVKALNALADELKSADANDQAYLDVYAKIQAANAEIAKAQNELYKEMPLSKVGYPENPYDQYNKAFQKELGEKVGSLISKANISNGTVTNHPNASAEKANNEALINQALAELPGVLAAYQTLIRESNAAYDALTLKRNALKAQLDGITNQDVKAAFPTEIAALNDKKAALDKKIEAAFLNTSITTKDDKGVVVKDALAKEADDLSAEITKFVDGPAAPVLKNFNENARITEAIKGLQDALNAAVAEVKKLKVTGNDAYSAEAKFAATIAKQQDAINKATAARDAQYAANKAAKKYDKAIPEPDYNAIRNAIAQYQANATSTVAKLSALNASRAELGKSIDALVKKAVDTAVELGGDKTYATEIAALKAYYNGTGDAIAAACAKNDDEHLKAVAALDNIEGSDKVLTVTKELIDANKKYADELTAAYDENKAKYDASVNLKAAQKIAQQARVDIDEAQKEANKLLPAGSDKEPGAEQLYGVKYNEFKQKLESSVLNPLATELAKIPANDAITEANAVETIAQLKKVDEEIKKANAELEKLKAEAEAIKKAVAANAALYTELTNGLKNLDKQLNGTKKDGKVDYKGVLDLVNDDKDKQSSIYAGKVSAMQTKVNDLTSAINASNKAETLSTTKPDEKNDKGEVVKKGFDTQIADLLKEINKLRSEATLQNDNFLAKKSLETLYGSSKDGKQIAILIGKAESAVASNDYPEAGKGCASTGAGKTYFDGEIEKARTEFTNIQNAIYAGYNALTLKKAGDDGVIPENALKGRINALATALNGIITNAPKNEKAHQGATKTVTEIEKQWDEAYTKISTEFFQLEVQAILDKLNAEKTKLTAEKDKIETAWGKGTCEAQKAESDPVLSQIKAAIAEILKTTDENYDAAIGNDNLTRYNNFLAALKETKRIYSEAVTTVNSYYDIKDPAYQAEVADIKAAAQEVFEFSKDITSLETDAQKAFNAATGKREDGLKAFYDIDGEFIKNDDAEKLDTKQIQDGIKATLEAFQTKAREKADAIYNSRLPEVEAMLTAEMGKIADYNAEVQKNAFADVKKIIADAKEAFKAADFPTKLGAVLEQFDAVEGLLEAGREPAAAAEWAYLGNYWTEKIDREKAAMAGFVYLPNNTVDYAKNYKEQVEDVYAAATELAKAPLYGANIAKVHGKLSEISASERTIDKKKVVQTNVYWAAYDASANNDANNAAIASINAVLDAAQKALDDAKAYAGSFIVYNTGEVVSVIKTPQDEIDGYRAAVETYKKQGGAVQAEAIIKAKYTDAYKAAYVNAIQEKALDAEKSELLSQVELLKQDVNSASIVESLPAEKLEEYRTKVEKTLPKAIEEAGKHFTDKENTKKDYTKQQAAYLAVESDIAALKDELTSIYNGEAVAKMLAELNAGVKEVEDAAAAQAARLDECHAPVRKAFGDELKAAQDEIASIKAYIAAKDEEKSILLYAENIKKDIRDVKKVLDEMAPAVEEMEAPYAVNEEVYKQVSEMFSAQRADIEALKAKIDAYKYLTRLAEYQIEQNNPTTTKQGFIDDLDALLFEATKEGEFDGELVGLEKNLNYRYESGDELFILCERDIELYKNALLRNVTEEVTRIDQNSVRQENLNAIYYLGVDADAVYQDVLYPEKDRIYSEAAKKEFANTIKDIRKQLDNWSNYNRNAFYGSTDVDIDGNETLDKDGNPVMVDYLAEAAGIMSAKQAAVESAIEAFANKVATDYYIVGDATGDRNVFVDDYMLIVKYVLGAEEMPEASSLAFLASDINADGEINIGDITAVSKIITRGTNGRYAKAMAKAKAKTVSDDAVSIAATPTGENSYRLTVSVDNAANFAGAQMDIELPAGMTLTDESLGGSASDLSLYSNDLENGVHRVVISSPEGAAFADGGNEVLCLDVTVADGKSLNKLAVTNIVMADKDARTYKMKGVNGNFEGTVGIENATTDEAAGIKQKIYSVGGVLLNKLQKGINIIRNSDGTTKKVFKK